MFITLLVVLAGVTLSAAECPECTCFSVNQTQVNLYELLNYTPLYSQVASNSSLSSNFDSVCLSFSATHTKDAILAEIKFSYSYGNSSQTASVQSATSDLGHFSIVAFWNSDTEPSPESMWDLWSPGFLSGPTNYEDFIIGVPCPGTYVIYRCLQIDSCTTDPLAADLIISSIRRKDSPYCVERGIAMAQESFPGIGFYSLPNTAVNPCSKYY